MTNYKAIQDHCQKTTDAGISVMDEFLLYYAAARERLDREMDTRLAPYRHVTQRFDPSWVNYIKSQYIAHRLFRKDGLIGKYINHSAVKELDPEGQRYLRQQSGQPWRFSFSVIIARPAAEFFEMQDVFTSEKFLLYSTGTTEILSEHPVVLWLNLIAFNGMCWQSYGPISHYRSFGPEDIRYFASELNPRELFGTGEEIMENVEQNPISYLMLMNGATFPAAAHKDELMEHHFAEYDDDAFSTSGMEQWFRIEYNQNVYRLSLKKWSDHPHFATAFYDEKEALLLISAMTARGFAALIKKFNQCGYELEPQPDFRVSIGMFGNTETILKKKHSSLRYHSLFEEPTTPEHAAELNKLNEFLTLALPDINSGRDPNVEELAKKTGVDPETARQMIRGVMDKLRQNRL